MLINDDKGLPSVPDECSISWRVNSKRSGLDMGKCNAGAIIASLDAATGPITNLTSSLVPSPVTQEDRINIVG